MRRFVDAAALIFVGHPALFRKHYLLWDIRSKPSSDDFHIAWGVTHRVYTAGCHRLSGSYDCGFGGVCPPATPQSNDGETTLIPVRNLITYQWWVAPSVRSKQRLRTSTGAALFPVPSRPDRPNKRQDPAGRINAVYRDVVRPDIRHIREIPGWMDGDGGRVRSCGDCSDGR